MSQPRLLSGEFWTAPNLVSLARIALTPVVAWAILSDHGTLAFGLFCVVVGSDVLDGIIARSTQQASPLGTLIDHGADAIFVTTMAVIFGSVGLIPTALSLLIPIAFIQYVADSSLISGASLRASKFGRWNGIAYYALAGFAIFVNHFASIPSLQLLLLACGWILVVTTVISVAERAIYRLSAKP